MEKEWIAFIGTVIGAIIGASVGLTTAWLAWKQYQKERGDKFKLIAAEKRLGVYQDAFTKWVDLMRALPREEDAANQIAYDCQQWWYQNCIYLSPRTRDSFKVACSIVSFFHTLRTAEERRSNREQVEEVGTFISEDVDLPPITGDNIRNLLEEDG